MAMFFTDHLTIRNLSWTSHSFVFVEICSNKFPEPPEIEDFFRLLGNHELMNLQGDFRYATPADTASIAALEPDLKGAGDKKWRAHGDFSNTKVRVYKLLTNNTLILPRGIDS